MRPYLLRWHGLGLALAVAMAQTPARAEVADSLEVQVRHARAFRVDDPVERVLVVSPDIVEATTIGRDAVELFGLSVGRSMVLIWTERTRYVLIVNVVPEPWQPDAPTPRDVMEAPTPGMSLYSYVGNFGTNTSDVSSVMQQHQVTAYTPVGPGHFFGLATATVTPQNQSSLNGFYLRYRDPLTTIEGGDIAARMAAVETTPAAIRGLAAEYHGSKLRIGAYGGLEPGGTRPHAVLDPDRPLRLGAYSGLELAPNADVSLMAVRRDGFITAQGPQTTMMVAPSMRWEPTSSLGFSADGGVSQTGQAFKAQARYHVPAVQLDSSYWHQSDGFAFDGFLRTDIATVSALVRPSRAVYMWGVATRSARGSDALGEASTTVAASGSESAYIVALGKPVLDRIQLGVVHLQNEITLPLIAERTESREVSLTLDRSLPAEFGTLQLVLLAGDGAHVRDSDEGELSKRGSDLRWRYGSKNLYFTFGGGYLEHESRGALAYERERYALEQTLSITLPNFLTIIGVQLARESTAGEGTSSFGDPDARLTQDFVSSFLTLLYRPTRAHEFRLDAALSNVLFGAQPGIVAPPAYGNRPSNVDLMLTYSFHFGDAVEAPSVLDMLYTESVVIEAFLDLDEDGERDEDEPPVEELSVTVDGGPKQVTNDSGISSFRGVGPGMHRYVVDVNGAGAGGRRLRFTTASSRSIYVAPGEEAIVHVGLSDRAQIVGAVFNDTDLDTQRQGTEPGFGGVPVTLYQGDQLVASTASDSSGGFKFRHLAPGPYTVRIRNEQLPGECEALQTELSVDVGSSDLVRAALPVIANRVVEGVVFVDSNGNGLRDDGEQGLSKVDIKVGDRSVTSNGGGKYLIRRLRAGNVELVIDPVSLPPGHEPSPARVPIVMPASPTKLQVDLPVVRQRRISGAPASPGARGT